MKQKIFSLCCFFIFFTTLLFADRKNLNEAEIVVENANKAYIQALEDKQYRDFLPYFFAEAEKNLLEAKKQLIKEADQLLLAELAIHSSIVLPSDDF